MVEEILIPFGNIKEIITEMESEEFNTNLTHVAEAFTCIDNICTNFLKKDVEKHEELRTTFALIKDLLREHLFDNGISILEKF